MLLRYFFCQFHTCVALFSFEFITDGFPRCFCILIHSNHLRPWLWQAFNALRKTSLAGWRRLANAVSKKLGCCHIRIYGSIQVPCPLTLMYCSSTRQESLASWRGSLRAEPILGRSPVSTDKWWCDLRPVRALVHHFRHFGGMRVGLRYQRTQRRMIWALVAPPLERAGLGHGDRAEWT